MNKKLPVLKTDKILNYFRVTIGLTGKSVTPLIIVILLNTLKYVLSFRATFSILGTTTQMLTMDHQI